MRALFRSCLLAAGLTGCVADGPALMLPASPAEPIAHDSITPPRDSAVVVFVRGRSSCDGGSPYRIVSEGLAFVGESAPGTKFASIVPPGRHAFFAWQPFGDVPPLKYPLANQVGAVEADFEAAHLYVVEVRLANDPFGTRKTCGRYQWVRLRRVDPFADADVSQALGDAAPMSPDLAAGQRVVDAHRDEVERHVALGMKKLRPSGPHP